MNPHDDDGIRPLIERIDPARHLAPATDDEKKRLMENAMTDQSPSSADQDATAKAARRRRAGIIGSIGAAVAAAAAVAIIIPLALGSSSGSPTSLELPGTGGPMDMCAPVAAETIATADTAFRGEVTGIADGVVTLAVVDRFAGEPGDSVEVAQGEDTAVDGAPIVFEEGTVYLVAAREGMILTCGSSAEDSPELAAFYSEAFPG